MSVIGGLVNTEEFQVETNHLELIYKALQIHGPDKSGISTVENCDLVPRIRCITHEDYQEKQPLTDGFLTLVADVRLDNREELASRLGTRIKQNHQTTDSSLILQSFRKWGETCLDHLIGAFTFAIWNANDQSLFLARDPKTAAQADHIEDGTAVSVSRPDIPNTPSHQRCAAHIRFQFVASNSHNRRSASSCKPAPTLYRPKHASNAAHSKPSPDSLGLQPTPSAPLANSLSPKHFHPFLSRYAAR